MKKHLKMSGAALLATGFFILMLGLYAAWYATVARQTAEATALRAELLAREAAGGRAAQARRALETIEIEERRVYGHLVSPNDIVPFLETLEAAGEEVGTDVEVVSVGEAPAGVSRITLSLRIKGSFNAVLRALGAIEYQPYDIRLTNLTFDTVVTEGGVSSEWTAAAMFSVGMQTASTTPRAAIRAVPEPAPAAEAFTTPAETATSTEPAP